MFFVPNAFSELMYAFTILLYCSHTLYSYAYLEISQVCMTQFHELSRDLGCSQ